MSSFGMSDQHMVLSRCSQAGGERSGEYAGRPKCVVIARHQHYLRACVLNRYRCGGHLMSKAPHTAFEIAPVGQRIGASRGHVFNIIVDEGQGRLATSP